MKIFISGPMRGIQHFNAPVFDTAAVKLRRLGHTVFNPVENDRANGFECYGKTGHEELSGRFELRRMIAQDLDWITDQADAVATLPGWEISAGARAEVATAKAVGVHVYPANDIFFYAEYLGNESASIEEMNPVQLYASTYAGARDLFGDGLVTAKQYIASKTTAEEARLASDANLAQLREKLRTPAPADLGPADLASNVRRMIEYTRKLNEQYADGGRIPDPEPWRVAACAAGDKLAEKYMTPEPVDTHHATDHAIFLPRKHTALTAAGASWLNTLDAYTLGDYRYTPTEVDELAGCSLTGPCHCWELKA